jgi:hypothetical protein
MASRTRPDDELIRSSRGEGRPGDRVGDNPLDEDRATRFTRGVVDGFTEASQAFSAELEGTNRFPELMGRSLAGVIRANARLLDEVATAVRQATEGWGSAPRRPEAEALDYEHLADLVAARINSTGPVTGTTAAPGARTGGRKA